MKKQRIVYRILYQQGFRLIGNEPVYERIKIRGVRLFRSIAEMDKYNRRLEELTGYEKVYFTYAELNLKK